MREKLKSRLFDTLAILPIILTPISYDVNLGIIDASLMQLSVIPLVIIVIIGVLNNSIKLYKGFLRVYACVILTIILYSISALVNGLNAKSIMFLFSYCFYIHFGVTISIVAFNNNRISNNLYLYFTYACIISSSVMLLQVINVLPIDLLPSVTGIDRTASGLMNNRNKLIFNVLPALIFSFYVCTTKKGINNKLIFSLLFITILISGGRAGFILELIAIPYVTYKLKYKKVSGNIFLIFIVSGIILYFTFDVIHERTRLLLSTINVDSFIYQDQSVMLRLELLNSTTQLIKEYPIFGVGPGMFRSVSLIVDGVELNAHNTYMGIAAETGIIGVIAIIIFTLLPKIASKNKLSNSIYGIIFIFLLLNALFYDVLSEPIIYVVLGVLIGRNARVNYISKNLKVVSAKIP